MEGREINCRYLGRGRSGGSRAQFPGSSRRKEQEAAGSISGTDWERGARGRWFNFQDLEGERSKRSVVQFPGPSRREEQEFAGLISGT